MGWNMELSHGPGAMAWAIGSNFNFTAIWGGGSALKSETGPLFWGLPIIGKQTQGKPWRGSDLKG